MMNGCPFTASTAFCPLCGSILPLLQQYGMIKCYTCGERYDRERFASIKLQYTINFNTVSKVSDDKKQNEDSPEGPVVERRCPKCGHDKMSYATLQLRSADEGQTVFYTCISCKFKETENS